MGISIRSQSAVLVSLLVVLSIGHAHAATRKYVKMPSDSSATGSGRPTSSSGDKLYVPGDGMTEYIPANSGSGKTRLPVDPTYQYSKDKIAKGMANKLKLGNVAGIGLTVGLEFMLDQVGGFIDENGQPAKRVEDDGSGYAPGPTDLKWVMAKPHASTPSQPIAGSSSAVCQIYGRAFAAGYGDVAYVGSSISSETATQATCSYQWSQNGRTNTSTSIATRSGETCPSGYDRAGNSCLKTSTTGVPLTSADYDLMEAAVRAKESDWLRDRLREHCEGALNPQGCYDMLRESTSLSGPSSVSGPSESTTGTYTRPDGTTGTTGSTTNVRYDIKYGDNYYDYSKTTTTTKTQDGQKVSEETTTESPEVDQEEPVEDIAFTDSEFPPVEPFYVQKYPEGLQGVWDNAKADFDNSEFMSFLHSFVPQFSGSCPSWSMSFSISSWANYGTIGFVNLCYVFDFIKVVILVTALFTARAITFGG